jgi:Domain of unknown function (DUF4160)
MPEVSRFFGISIYLYPREHPPEHFHALYGDEEAVFDIESLRVLQGSLSNRARSLVVEWAALHRDELFTAWQRLRAGQNPGKIAPLE